MAKVEVVYKQPSKPRVDKVILELTLDQADLVLGIFGKSTGSNENCEIIYHALSNGLVGIIEDDTCGSYYDKIRFANNSWSLSSKD